MKKHYFETKEQYEAFISTWKEEFKAARKLERNQYGNKIRQFTDLDFFFYAIIRGKDPRKCYHSPARYEDAFADMQWYMSSPERVQRKFGKFFRDGGLTLDLAMQIWHDFESEEEAA